MKVKISNGELDYTATVEYDEGGVNIEFHDSDPGHPNAQRTTSVTFTPETAKALAAVLTHMAFELEHP